MQNFAPDGTPLLPLVIRPHIALRGIEISSFAFNE